MAGGSALFVCRVGQDLFAFRNVCARCAGPPRRRGASPDGSAGRPVTRCSPARLRRALRGTTGRGMCRRARPAPRPAPAPRGGHLGVRRGAGSGGRMNTPPRRSLRSRRAGTPSRPVTPGDVAPDQQQPPPVAAGERCEMCSAPVADEHQHVVDVNSRSLMCTCRAVLPAVHRPEAQLRYRAVPDRYLAFPGFVLGRPTGTTCRSRSGWRSCSSNTAQDRVVAFYPSPAGATESELSMEAWDRVLEANPGLDTVLPDVEALLVRGIGRTTASAATWSRSTRATSWSAGCGCTWRGFDGGQEARAGARRVLRDGRCAQLAGGGAAMTRLDVPASSTSRRAVRRCAEPDRQVADRGGPARADPRDRPALPGAHRAPAPGL